MASLALGAVGGYFFGPLGFLVGSAIGNLLQPQKQEGPKLTDLHTTTSAYGEMIPIVYGKYRVPLKVIWADQLQEHSHHSGGKGGPRLASSPYGIRRAPRQGKGGPEVTTFTYTCSFYGHLCIGPIVGIRKIWLDKQLVWDIDQTGSADLPFTVFRGTTSQDPFSAAETILGVGNVSAYRGKAGMGWDTLELADYGNRIPNIEVEVLKDGGPIPWRVSTFDPYHGVNHNSVQWGGRGGATLTDGVLTSLGNMGAGSGGTWSEWTQDIYGALVGSPSNTSFGIAAMPGDGGAGTVLIGPCINGPQYAAYIPAGGDRAGWYVHGVYQSDITNFTTGANEFVVTQAMVKGEFVYAIGNGSIQRFPLAGEVPSPTPDLIANLPYHDVSHTSLYKFGDSNDNYIYVSYSTGFSSEYFKISQEDLSVVDTVPVGDTPASFAGQAVFMVYDGQLVFNGIDADSAVGYSLYVYIDDGVGSSPRFSLVGKTDQMQGGFSYLGIGLVVGGDGVISLVPPELGITLAEIVADLSDKSQLSLSEYDVTSLTDIVPGFCVSNQVATRDAISVLQNAWPFDAAEMEGVVTFIRRGSQSIVTIADDDLAAHSSSDLPDKLGIKRALETTLPRTVYTKYANVDADYQDGSQYERRLITNSKSDITLEMAVAISDAYGKVVAQVYLFGSWLGRTTFTFYTSMKYAYLHPTNVIIIRGYTMRIQTKKERRDKVIEWTAVQDDPSNWVRAGSGVVGAGQSTPTLVGKVPTTLQVLDLPLLEDTDSPNGYYAAAYPTTETTGWSANLYKSTDGGTSYTQINGTTTPDVTGTITGMVNWTGGNMVDESTVGHVTLQPGGTLSTCTYDELLNGSNQCLVGSHEVAQFRDATLTAELEYDLTGWLRGRRGTEWAQPAHFDGEGFVLLPTTMNPPGPIGEVQVPVKFKGVTKGTAVANATAVDFTNMGNALKPYAPVQLGGGVANASGDVTLNWVRRTRIGGAWLSGVDVPLSESTEGYIVQIWDSSYTLCARIITVGATQTTTYTSAQQVTDFGAQQQNIYFTVGQIGAIGLGIQARGSGPGLGASSTTPTTPIVPYADNPIISPPPPSGGTLPVDHIFTQPAETVTLSSLQVGQTWVGKFTTGASIPTAGQIQIFEYGGPPLARNLYVATDSGGLNIVGPYGLATGTTATLHFGTGAFLITLSPTTIYYVLTDFNLASGYPAPVGTSAASRIVISGITP